jgi:hypothetical protein
MVEIVVVILGAIAGAILNRLRGTKAVFAWVAAAVLGAYVFWLSGAWLPAILVGLAYILGENWGWTKWINCIHFNMTQYQYNQRWAYPKEMDAPYYEHIMQWFLNDRKDYKPYVFVGMVIRGLLWWLPVMLVLWWFSLVTPLVAVLATVGLAVAFPLVYKFAYGKQFMGKYLKTAEVDYGALYGAVLVFIL